MQRLAPDQRLVGVLDPHDASPLAPLLARPQEVTLLTRRGEAWTGRRVWVVAVEGQAYVRSASGARGAWYRRALTDPRVQVVCGDLALDVLLQPVPDPLEVAEVSLAYWRVYGPAWPGPTALMTSPEAAGTTSRLLARAGDGHRGETTP